MRFAALCVGALGTLLLAGCTGSNAVLTMEGEGPGEGTLDVECKEIDFWAQPALDGGHVTVELTNGPDRAPTFPRTYGPTSGEDTARLAGEHGSWHLVGTRSPDFVGRIELKLRCV